HGWSSRIPVLTQLHRDLDRHAAATDGDARAAGSTQAFDDLLATRDRIDRYAIDGSDDIAGLQTQPGDQRRVAIRGGYAHPRDLPIVDDRIDAHVAGQLGGIATDL